MNKRAITPILLLLAATMSPGEVLASSQLPGEPGWSRGVLLFGEAREEKNATPILLRDYRPLHFYGNTVRRRHYRGKARPTASDLIHTVRPGREGR
jgi:hypothetical protein